MPVVPSVDRAPLPLPRSKTPDPFVPPKRRPPSAQDLCQPRPDAAAAPPLPGHRAGASALPAPMPWSPRRGGVAAPASQAPALTAQQLAQLLGARPFELGPAAPHKSVLEVLLMVQDLVVGERLRPFAPGTLVGGAAARYLACSPPLAPPAVWDVLVEVPDDGPGRAARAAAQAQRNGNKGRARHFAAALDVQGPMLTVTSRTGTTVLRVHLCAPGQAEVPGALACEQLLLRCQGRGWSASGGLSLPEAMVLAASGQYRAPQLDRAQQQQPPEDVTAALTSLLATWRLQQVGYRPQALFDRADLAAVARLGDHLAQLQQLQPGAASQAAIQLVHHTIAPHWAPLASAPMRQQLGLAATAWAFLSQWQRHAPATVTLVPLIAGLHGLCASHMDRACPDARLAFAIVQGLCAEGSAAALWRRLLAALPPSDADSGQPHVVMDTGMLSVALPIWRTHVFVAADDDDGAVAPLDHLHGELALTALCADEALGTVGQRLARALGCPPLAELFDHPVAHAPRARQDLAQALGAYLAVPEACPLPLRPRLVFAMAVLAGEAALAHRGAEVRAAFSLQQLCDAWGALPPPASDTQGVMTTALGALLQPHIQALAGAPAPGGALRPVLHKLAQQLARRGLHAQALALLEVDPPLGAQVGGHQALALLAASHAERPSPALEAQLLVAVARHRGACQALVHKEPSLWRPWATRPASSVSLAHVFANVGPVPSEPLLHWLEAVHAAEDLAPLVQFVTAVGPEHPNLGDALIMLAELAHQASDSPGLRQALASLAAARPRLDPQVCAQVALALLCSAEDEQVLEVTPQEQLLLAEEVLLGHPGVEARRCAMDALADLSRTPVAGQAMSLVLSHCDQTVLGQLSPHEIYQLFDLIGLFTTDVMPQLSAKAADNFVMLLIRLPTTTAKEAAAVAPLNVKGLAFLLERGHFAAGQKLIECQMRSPAAVRLSLQAFKAADAVDLGQTWRCFFDHCARSMQTRPALQLTGINNAPPASRFVLAMLVVEGLRAELRDFEQLADRDSNLEAQMRLLDSIIYGLRRRHSLVRLLPDELLLQEIAGFVARHDLGQQGLMRLHSLGSVRLESDSGSGTHSGTLTQAASTPQPSVQGDISHALKGALLGTLDPIDRAMHKLAQASQPKPAEPAEPTDDDSLPIELWTVMLSSLQQQPLKVQHRWAHTSFQHTAGRSVLGALYGQAEQPPLSHRQAIIASKWAAQLLTAPGLEQAGPPPLWSMLCCAHLEDPSAVLRLTQLTLSMAQTGISRHPIAVAIDSLPLQPDRPLDAAELQRFQLSTLHILMAAIIVADTLAPQAFAEQIGRLLDAQTVPLEDLSALPWRQMIDELKHVRLGAPSPLAERVQAFEGRCLAACAAEPLQQLTHLHALEQQLDAWILRLHRGETHIQRHSLNGIFGLLPTFFELSSFTQEGSINHIFGLLSCNPEFAALVREELLAAVYARPDSFDSPDPVKLIFDILFATDPRADQTLGNFLAIERLKQNSGVPLPAYWATTRRFFIGQTSIDELRDAQNLSTILATLLALDGLPQRRFPQLWAQKKVLALHNVVCPHSARAAKVAAPRSF